ncbi:MAG: hypothetical protein V3S10_04225 [Dehalococcoidales bacterium]
MGSRARRGDRTRRHAAWWQTAVIAVIIAAVVFSFGLNVMSPGGRSDLPERLGTLELVGAIEGEEAMSRVEGLHGIGLELTSAYIVEYVHGSERGSVWVGRTVSSTTAEALTERMRAAIEEGDSVFSNVRQTLVAGRPVYRVDGPGGDHFFYHSERHGKQVVWLTVNAAHPLDILAETVKYY